MRHSLALITSALALFVLPAQAESTKPQFDHDIASLEKKNGGRLGVSVVSASGAPIFAHRDGERFATCSTFKALLGAFILSRVDSNLESLDRLVPYTSADILSYAPIAKENLSKGQMSIAELNAASIQYSDNTAANLLLTASGGPAGLTAYLRSIGDSITRLDRNEPGLNSNIPGDVRDTTTPKAMAGTLQRLLVGDKLSPASKEQFKALMLGNTTGDTRLRAGLDKSWMVGDKTGTCDNGATNDVGIVYPRGLQPFIIAVFYTGSTISSEARSEVIAEVARITHRNMPRPKGK